MLFLFKLIECFRPAESGNEISRYRRRGMVLPFEQHTLTFDEITYSVDMPQVACNNVNVLEMKRPPCL
jgi:hypothetical protein